MRAKDDGNKKGNNKTSPAKLPRVELEDSTIWTRMAKDRSAHGLAQAMRTWKSGEKEQQTQVNSGLFATEEEAIEQMKIAVVD
eukprot:7183891-Pyramimonas_sp.AAC.1